MRAATAPFVSSVLACGGEQINAPTEFALRVKPSEGPPPLRVSFDVRAPALADIARFELDADGDGTFERHGSTAAAVEGEQIFARRGTYTLTLKVSDPLGASRETQTRVTVTGGGVAFVRQRDLKRGFAGPAMAPNGSELYLWDYDTRS